jgi:ribosome-binding ATPase YchF (GTP1/OBG family)
MAQEPADEESEYDDDEEEEELYDDDVLRGFRLFMANIEDEEHDEEDIIQEQYEEHLREAAEEREREHELDNGLTPEYVAQRLVLQGVGMIDLVKVLLLGHDEFERRNEEFDRLDGEMYGKLRTIISNYER